MNAAMPRQSTEKEKHRKREAQKKSHSLKIDIVASKTEKRLKDDCWRRQWRDGTQKRPMREGTGFHDMAFKAETLKGKKGDGPSCLAF